MRRLLWALGVLIGLSLALPGPLPAGTWTALTDLRVQYLNPNMVLIIRNATYVIAENGIDYTYYGLYSISNSPTQNYKVSFRGSAVCTGGANEQILITYDDTTCEAPGVLSWFCKAGSQYYAGVFNFGVANDGSVLLFNGLSGAQTPLEFRCALEDASCGSSTSCNSTIIVQSITNLYGGSLNATQSSVTLVNSTATFEGNEITLQNNNDVTIQQSNTMNQTTVWVIGMPKWCYHQANGTEFCLL